jgi:hypothetical protein
MKAAKFLIVCLFMVSFFAIRAQRSQCLDYVKFDYSLIDCSNGLSNGEIHIKNLDPQQKLEWHLIPNNNLFEKNYLKEDVLRNIPSGEYNLIVRDRRTNGKCSVNKLVVIKR